MTVCNVVLGPKWEIIQPGMNEATRDKVLGSQAKMIALTAAAQPNAPSQLPRKANRSQLKKN